MIRAFCEQSPRACVDLQNSAAVGEGACLFSIPVAGVRPAGLVDIIWTLMSWKNTCIPDALPANLLPRLARDHGLHQYGQDG